VIWIEVETYDPWRRSRGKRHALGHLQAVENMVRSTSAQSIWGLATAPHMLYHDKRLASFCIGRSPRRYPQELYSSWLYVLGGMHVTIRV
jgi:hypothetical protein